MRAEYKRDMNHNYLILYGDQDVDTSSYQVRMLAGNVLPSVLKCRLQRVDGNMMYYFDVTSRQSIASFYEQKKFKMEDLKFILGGFVQAMEQMGEYLLNPGQLVFDPDYLFMDVEKKSLFFCYLPGYEKEVQEQFRAFTEYILPKLDHEDGGAVMLGYGVYRRALEDSFHLEHVKEELFQVRTEKAAEIPVQEPVFMRQQEIFPEDVPAEDEALWSREDTAPENADKPKGKAHPKRAEKQTGKQEIKQAGKAGKQEIKQTVKQKIVAIAALLSAVAVLAGILTASLQGYLPWLRVEIALGAWLVFLGCGILTYIGSERKRRKKEENWKQEVAKRREVFENQQVQPKEQIQESTELPKREKEMCQPLGDCKETVILSANVTSGPASLVSREPGELATIYLKDELTIIGKLENACDAVIPLPTVSRIHGKIRKREEEYFLTDLNSRNGTSVNGRMLKGDEEYQLQNEDEVDFAQARYVFLK